MLLHTDVPSTAQIDQLMAVRNPATVSIYLPTQPDSNGEAERLELKNQIRTAVQTLQDQGVDKRTIDAVDNVLTDYADDPQVWPYMARSLAIFATPDGINTYRLPNNLQSHVQAADRFYVKPLLRAVSFPQLAYVLALTQNSVRLLEVLPEGPPFEVDVAGLPKDVADAAGVPSVRGRNPDQRGRIQGSEGQKVRMGQYAHRVNQAIRPVLSEDIPLIIAATEPLASIFRSACTYPGLAAQTISGNPETTPDAELAAKAREVLDEIFKQRLSDASDLYDQRRSQGRIATDLAGVARAATYGAVDTVYTDINSDELGTIDDASGEITFTDDPLAYPLLDEIVRRVWEHGGRVVAVRESDVPGGGAIAAFLRYSISAA